MVFEGTDGNEIELSLNFTKISNQKIELNINFPENYPNTPFKLNNKYIAKLMAIFKDKDMFLREFYVYTHSSLDKYGFATKEERLLTKGLGESMLCAAIDEALQNDVITKDSKIYLEASGGYCNDVIIKDKEYDKWKEKDLDMVMDQFPKSIKEIKEDFRDVYKRDITKKDKINIVCQYLQNLKLVEYYKKYGLKEVNVPIEERDIYFVKMYGTIKDILTKCKE